MPTIRTQQSSRESFGLEPELLATLERLAASSVEPDPLELVSDPWLHALEEAGTRHVYADTGAPDELARAARVGGVGGGFAREIDGSTLNQPLLAKVVDALPAGHASAAPREWARELRERHGLEGREAHELLHVVACARVANGLVRRFGAGRAWEPSLQLPMSAAGKLERGLQLGRLTRRLAPQALVKVPFRPQAPDCLIVARRLEQEGIPVNLTSTFSARQAVLAALVCGATRTNVFLGRLDAAFGARKLGAHVTLEAQRALRGSRAEGVTRTQLIVASVRGWESFADTAGCDVYTAPPKALLELRERTQPSELVSRLETSWEAELGLDPELAGRIGPDALARLWSLEPELLEHLRALRTADEEGPLRDGESLRLSFHEAGFGDLFHAPTPHERTLLGAGKLPDLGGALVRELALDTLFTLHADADFQAHQRTIDAALGGPAPEQERAPSS